MSFQNILSSSAIVFQLVHSFCWRCKFLLKSECSLPLFQIIAFMQIQSSCAEVDFNNLFCVCVCVSACAREHVVVCVSAVCVLGCLQVHVRGCLCVPIIMLWKSPSPMSMI